MGTVGKEKKERGREIREREMEGVERESGDSGEREGRERLRD